MAGVRPVSLSRRRPAGSSLVAAGTSSAKTDLAVLADRMNIKLDFVVLDDSGKIASLHDSVRPDEVELLWCHGRFKSSWVKSAMDELPSLDWVHSDFVGVDGLSLESFAQRGIVITNGGDNFARPMAEWVVLGMLASAKRYPFFVRNSDAAIWDASVELSEMKGAKVLLLGLGSVNSLVAEMCKVFDMDVVAWTRTKHDSKAYGVSRQVTGDDWLTEIKDADYVVIGLPLTRQTTGLINESVLEIAKSDVTIINLARGAIIDEKSLVRVLDSGRIRYVLLDAYPTEPLSPSSPLWARDNVTVLPHHSWSSPRVINNTIERLGSELSLWMSGLPLADPVDFGAGY